MATLEKIRQRSGLLLIIIGLAILAFILTDLMQSGNSLFRGDANIVGRVNGNTIEYQEFQRRMDERRRLVEQQNPQQAAQITSIDLATAIWNDFLQEHVLYDNLRKQGFQVSPVELKERIKQNPTIKNAQAFRDPNTGAFSEFQFSRYLTSIEENRFSDEEAAQAYQQWVQFESSVKDQALTTKYYTALRQGLYVPQAIAKEEHRRTNVNRITVLTGLEYASIADSTVSYSDRDLKRYYQENAYQYKKEATRSLAFVNINIDASNKDRSELRQELQSYLQEQVVFNERTQTNDTLESFLTAEDDSLFAASRSDIPVGGGYATLAEIRPPLDSTLFEKEIGSVVGPYEDGSFLRLTKIAGKKMIPDSVEARHILISYQGANEGRSEATRTPQQAQALADSLFEAVKKDTSLFASLARENSDDPGSASRGGKLDLFARGQMVQPFDRFCFYNETGDIGMVYSQFGIHIIEITGQKGANPGLKLINIAREILPSDATIHSVYQVASSIATQATQSGGNLAEAAAEQGYTVRPIDDIKPFDALIPGIGNNREIVRWAFEDEREVGQINLFNNQYQSYAVVLLTGIDEEGTADFESVKEDIVPQVIQEKKAEVLRTKMAEALESGASDVKAVADQFGSPMINQEVTFNTATLTNFGAEPLVVGAIAALPVNELSEPLAGDRAVYLFQVSKESPYAALPSYASQQVQQQGRMRNRVNTAVYDALKELAKVDDRRGKFY